MDVEAADPESMLSLHRSALRLRHQIPGLRSDEFSWRDSADGVLDFDRGPTLRCGVNISAQPIPLDASARVLLSSAPVEQSALPADAAAWLAAD
jgi:alpha-glucosidase